MKKLYKIQLFILFALFIATFAKSQCSSNFNFTQNSGGNVTFTSTSTGTFSSTYYSWNYGDATQNNGTALTQVSHTYPSNGVYTATLSIYNFSICTSSFTQNIVVTTSPCTLALSGNFTYTTGSAGLVNFTSTSTGTSVTTSYFWNFGDGNTSTAQNPAHTYTTNNNFAVQLVVSDGTCTDSIWKNVAVSNVPCTMTAGFTYSVGAGGNVTFTSTSTGTNSTTYFVWNFGDATSAGGNPTSHTYGSNGTYVVTFTVANSTFTTSSTCSATASQTILVSTSPCSVTLNASFTYTNTTAGNVNFLSTSTNTSATTNYYWDFGDGNTSTLMNPSHTYTNVSTYPVLLVITDAAAGFCQDSITTNIFVSNAPCLLNSSFTYSLGFNGTVYFNSTSTGTSSMTYYDWYYGDGNSTLYGSSFTTHTYTMNGTYVATLTAANWSTTCTNSSSQSLTVTIVVCNLVSNFTYTTGAAGTSTFVSNSTGTTPSTKYTWNFGDGNIQSSGNVPTINHTYSSNGSFWASLLIQDTLVSGCYDSTWQNVNISTAPCLVNANFTATQGPSGYVVFNSTSTNAWTGSNYYWDYGDGNNGTGISSANNYTAAGVYSVTLIVADSTSTPCVSSITKTVNVALISCSLSAGFTYTTGAAGNVAFTSTNTFTAFGVDYFWDFGDGNYDYVKNPVHTYSINNNYYVYLEVYDSLTYTCYDTLTQIVPITNTLCAANPNFYLAKSTSTTTNLWYAYPSYPGNITNAVWNWGDATSSTGLYPSHIYASTGWYNICLTVTVTCSATGSVCVFSNIYRMQANAETAGIAQINVLGGPTGITESKAMDTNFNLFPNPNNGTFNVALDPSYNSEASGLVIYNMLGEVIYSAKYQANEGLIKEIDLTNASNGAYFMQLNTTKGSFTKKLIINK